MFGAAHFHLLLNHLPIIVPAIALGLLVVALWKDDDRLARTGLVVLALGAATALPAYLTGEPAEETVDRLPGVVEQMIERHQDAALVGAVALGLLGLAALAALWRYRGLRRIPRRATVGVTAGAAIASLLMAYAGFLGGEIRHTEVRPASSAAGVAHVSGGDTTSVAREAARDDDGR